LYSQLLPITLFLVLDIVSIIGKFQVERDTLLKFRESMIVVHNPDLLSELGHINFALLDKTGTLTTSYQKLDSIKYGTKSFIVNHNKFFDSISMPSTRKKATSIYRSISQR
jgi:P-type E1-E2 ATPase